MDRITDYLNKNLWILYVSAIILLIPALLINLGIFPLISDEHIRGLVALEMIIRDDYFVPTMYGEYYLKKPPLFNWILIGFTNIFGNFNEFTLRLPTVIATFLYGGTIYLALHKKYSSSFAFVSALVFVTCGRMLFWDTQLALIDITFSWVVFTNFIVIYYYMKKGNYFMLFLISYILTAIAYMFKGLPSIVFQGTTLLVFFVYQRKFLKLISWQHILGILVFAGILLGYYTLYFASFPGTFEDVITTLFGETTRRTVLRFGWERTIHHYMMFPFDQLYHFLPWSLLILFILNLKIFGKFFTKKKCRFYLIIFLLITGPYYVLYKEYAHVMLLGIPLIILLFLQLYKTASDHLKKDEIIQIRYSKIAVIINLLLIGSSFLVDEGETLFKVIQYTVTILLFALIAFTTRFVVNYRVLFREDFIKYLTIIFFANLLVYWTSPEVHPRYILMLAPLFFIVILKTYRDNKNSNGKETRIIETAFIAMALIASIGVFLLLFLPDTRNIDFITLKTLLLFAGLGFFSLLLIKMKQHRLLIFGIILIIVRIGFNWSVMEARSVKAHEVVSRNGAIELAEKSKGKELYIYKDSWMDDFGAFYITRERMQLLKRQYQNFDTNALYIIDHRFMHEVEYDSLYHYEIVWDRKPANLVRIKDFKKQ